LVELQGRVGVNAYMGKDGDAKAALTFHVNSIKLHGKSNAGNAAAVMPMVTTPAPAIADDLPF
jgi:single-strand DNA-binding protein